MAAACALGALWIIAAAPRLEPAALPRIAAAHPGVDSALAPAIHWMPDRVTQGAVFRIVTDVPSADSAATLSGTLAGEPLHFASAGSRTYTALAAVPVDAADTVVATIVVQSTMGTDTLATSIPVAHGDFSVEKLRVARRFGKEPDSSTGQRISAEQEKAQALAREAHEAPKLWTAPFMAPRPSRITSPYGGARVFNRKVLSRHMGVDFAGARGDPVRAANRGVVALVDHFYLGGRVVYIDHGAGLTTGYLHLSKILVHVGDTVSRGQLIGRVGASGRVTGPHLHWAVRYGNITVDGESLLRLPP